MGEDLVKSLDSVLETLDSAAKNQFDDTDISFDADLFKGHEFDLTGATDEVQQKEIDVDPFMLSISETVDRNNSRLAKAMESLINLSVTSARLVKAQQQEIISLREIVERIASQPLPTKAAVSSTEAAALKKSIKDRSFSPPVDDATVGVEESEKADFWTIRPQLVKALRNGFEQRDAGWEDYGTDLVMLESVCGPVTMDQVFSSMTKSGKNLIKSLAEKSE